MNWLTIVKDSRNICTKYTDEFFAVMYKGTATLTTIPVASSVGSVRLIPPFRLLMYPETDVGSKSDETFPSHNI